MDLTLSLCLPRDMVSVPLSRRVTSQLLRSVGFHADDVADVEVALSEACSNVLQHSDNASEYEVRLDIHADHVVISVRDMGGGPPADTFERLAAHDDAEAGRGIPLMRALVDDLRFLRTDDGSEVRMERRLRVEPGSATAAVLLGSGVTTPGSSPSSR